eukprot:TRINITY_DN6284_c0_g1_i1.p1 TRINITY_DN6284_c0_g1~~TRINITY_DN6284_c0_g1_i1.p1  ORF type:complete len:454 (+),score=76.98 TRINITY_DN6284_c0_g1_i1:939-2300(+)
MDERSALLGVVSETRPHKSPTPHLINLLLMNVGFMGVFAAFNATQNLESSLVKNPHLGYYSIAALYAAFCFSAVFFSSAIVSFLKPRLGMIIGGFTYIGLTVANLFPIYPVMIPAGVLLGVGASILWASQGSYLTAAAGNYAQAKGQPIKSALGTFNGVFFGMFQSAIVAGNIASSAILGFHGKHGNHTKDTGMPTAEKILFYAFLGVGLLGVVLFMFLRKEEREDEDLQPKKTIGTRVLETFVVMKDPRMVFLSFIIFFNGFEQGFYAGDFNLHCISLPLEPGWVGYIGAAMAFTDAIFSVIFGKIADRFGKKFVCIFGFIAHFGVLLFLLIFLKVGPGFAYFSDVGNVWVLFVIAGIYGIADAAWNTFAGIVIGYYFTEQTEAGFSNSKLFSSAGFFTAFLWGDHFFPKLYACIAIVTFANFALVILDRFIAPLDGRNVISEKTKVIQDDD